MAKLTQEQALAELNNCRQAIKDLKEDRKRCWEVRSNQVYYHPPTTPGGGWTNKTQYYQDKINKLKQKYFFTEQV
jgi:hypothetical protein